MSELSKVQKMDRKELISYCEKNNVSFRTKDGTEDIRKKAIKSLISQPEVVAKPSKPVVEKKPVSKVPEKKVEKPTVKEVVKEDVIKQDEKYNVKLKQIGQNMIIVLDGEQYTKTEPDKEKREAIKSLIESINKRRTEKDTEKLLNIFKGKEKSLEKGAESVDINILAESVAQLTLQMKQMVEIVSKSHQEVQKAPVTQAPPSNRGGEKPYR